jgi:hypothetical protein
VVAHGWAGENMSGTPNSHSGFSMSTPDIAHKGRRAYRYEKMLPDVVATFYVPDRDDPDRDSAVAESVSREVFVNAVKSIPFPAIRVIQRELPTKDMPISILTDVICQQNGEGILWAARDAILNLNGIRHVFYTPEHTDVKMEGLPRSYVDLIHALADRSNGFVEQAISRQQRRSLGVSAEYREYIVVRRRGTPGALTLGSVLRRHPLLHAVRGHVRHYQSGKTVFVRPHSRGKGEMLQVKDYILASQSEPRLGSPRLFDGCTEGTR